LENAAKARGQESVIHDLLLRGIKNDVLGKYHACK
jgi:hypothetical protein